MTQKWSVPALTAKVYTIFCLFAWPVKLWQCHIVNSKEYSVMEPVESQTHALQEVKVQRILHEMWRESKTKGEDISPQTKRPSICPQQYPQPSSAFGHCPAEQHLMSPQAITAIDFCLVGHLLLPFLICVIRFYQFHIHMTLFLHLDNYAKLWRKPRFGTFAFIVFTLMVLFFLPLYNGLQKSHSPCPVQYLICFDFSTYLFIFTKGGGKTASMLSSSLSHFTLKKVESFSARAGYSTPSCSRQCISALSNRGVRDLESDGCRSYKLLPITSILTESTNKPAVRYLLCSWYWKLFLPRLEKNEFRFRQWGVIISTNWDSGRFLTYFHWPFWILIFCVLSWTSSVLLNFHGDRPTHGAITYNYQKMFITLVFKQSCTQMSWCNSSPRTTTRDITVRNIQQKN